MRIRRLGTMFMAGAIAAMIPQWAMAAGTPACTSIANSASVSYEVGTVPQGTITGAPATFVVGNKVLVTVEKSNVAPIPVVPNSTSAQLLSAGSYLSFTVTNGGNALQDYTFAATHQGGAVDPFVITDVDTFALSGVTAYVDVNNNQVYDGADTLSVLTTVDPTVTYPGQTDPGTRTVFIVPTGGAPVVPAAQADATKSVYALEAIANKGDGSANTVETQNSNGLVYKIGGGSCTADIVLADATHTSNVAGESAYDGKDTARNTFKVNTATINISKTSAVYSDPVNGTGPVPAPKAIPGAVIRYSIKISNTGGASATLATISDTLVNNLKIVSAGATWSVTGSTRATASGALTADLVAGDGLVHSDPSAVGGTLTATLSTILAADVPNSYGAGELKSGEEVTLTFDVTIE